MKKLLVSILIILHIVLFFLYFNYLFLYYISWDEGVYLAGAKRILEGEFPLRDFFFYHTPGDIFLLSFFFMILGKSFFTAKIMMVIFAMIAWVCLMFIVYKITKNAILTGIGSLLYFTILFSYLPLTHHWLGTFLVIITMMLFLNGINKEKINYLLLSGILGGITFGVEETKGFYLLIAYFIFLLTTDIKRGNFKRLFIFSAGAGAILFTYLIFMLISDSFIPYIETIKWVLTYYNKFNRYPFLYSEILYIKQSLFGFTITGSGLIYLLLILMLLVLPLCISIFTVIKYFLSKESEKNVKLSSSTIIAITYLSLFLSALYRPDLTRIITFISPIVICLWLCLQETFPKLKNNLLYLFTVILLFAIIPSYFPEIQRLVGSEKCKIISLHGKMIFSVNGASECSSVSSVASILYSNNQDKTFIYYWSPHLYFLFGIKNATSFDFYKPIIFSEEQVKKIIEELEKNKPTFVIKDTYLLTILAPNSVLYRQFPVLDRHKLIEADELDRYIMSHYHIEYSTPRFLILKRNTQ